MIAFLFFEFVFSIDENLFDDECYCATNPGECTPYCQCDPYCTQIEKDSFTFSLPQVFTDSEIACDTKHRISSFIHAPKYVSTFTIDIDGEQITCYSYKANSSEKNFIKSYSPEDFDMADFTVAINVDEQLSRIENLSYYSQFNNDKDSRLNISGDVTDGYLRGKPIETSSGKLCVYNDCNMTVLFGVDSNFVFNIQLDEARSYFDLSNFNIYYDSVSPINNHNSTGFQTVDSLQSIDAYWTFMFQLKGNSTDYRYVISKIKSEYIGPSSCDDCIANLHIKFIELAFNGKLVYETAEENVFSYSFSYLFDALLGQDDQDSLKVAGILSCIAILLTLWAYYSFFFLIE